MNRTWLVLLGALLVAGCTGEAAGLTTSSTVPSAPTSTTVVENTTTGAPTTIATSTTTTIAATTTTTTTTVPPLDRSDAATVGRMEADLKALLANGPRPSGSPSELAAAGLIEDSLRLVGIDSLTEPVPLPTGATSQNVLAVIGEGRRRVLVGAHYDSIQTSPGADDNGSGSVVILELARRLAETPLPGVEVTLVWFGAEEVLPGYARNDHHYGSRQMAAEMAAAGTLPDEMLSVDMVGFDDTILAATYRDLDEAAGRRLVAAGDATGAAITLSSRGDISDHEAFARAGVPAVMMWRPSNPTYHSAADTTVNWDHMLQNLAIIEAFVSSQ